MVDDETDLEMLVKRKFRRKIRENTCEFIFARNGEVALQKVQEHPDLDIILSDVMDGLSLLSRLPEANFLLKAIMVLAYGGMQKTRTAMSREAFDFVCKPVDFDELDLTMEKTIIHDKPLPKQAKSLSRKKSI